MSENLVPDAELLIAPGCAHCPVVLAGLADLTKQGRIGRLEVINIVARPDVARAYGVRGVPWMRIGPFELSGAHTPTELAAWVERAGSDEGIATYLVESLESGQLASVTSACRRAPDALLPVMLRLAGDLDTPFAVRIGIGAVIEDLAPEGLLSAQLDGLLALAASADAPVRADAAHYLGLVDAHGVRAALQRLAGDADAEVREIANESLATLDDGA